MEQVPVAQLAQTHGTPLYIYSKASLVEAWQRYQYAPTTAQAASEATPPILICYAVKANANLGILNVFAQLGAGFDIVSGGELQRVIKAGGDPRKVIFSGVGKQAWEIQAALEAQIKCFNVESIPELSLIQSVAQQLDIKAPISLRINPDVDPKTHPYISTGLKENKFGIAMSDALAAYAFAQRQSHLEIVGLDCHIGSQLIDTSPYQDALLRLIRLMDQLKARGIQLQHLDIGGGLGIRYRDETPPDPKALIERTLSTLAEHGYGELGLILEPGRSLVGNSGLLITQVQFLKSSEAAISETLEATALDASSNEREAVTATHEVAATDEATAAPDVGEQARQFAIVDAAMNDLLRPTLYEAYHGALPVNWRADAPTARYDIVGPVCETGDWLAKDRDLHLQPGDLIAIESAGAYGFVMSSQYNTRPRAAEVLVDGDQAYVIRRRETIDDLLAHEQVAPTRAD